MRSSRLAEARSARVFRVMEKTSFWVQRMISDIQVTLFAFQRLLAFGTQGIGILSCFVQEPLTFGVGLVPGLFQERCVLLVEDLVLVLKVVALFCASATFCLGVRKLGCDPFISVVNRGSMGL